MSCISTMWLTSSGAHVIVVPISYRVAVHISRDDTVHHKIQPFPPKKKCSTAVSMEQDIFIVNVVVLGHMLVRWGV